MKILNDNHYHRVVDILDDLCRHGRNSSDPADISYMVHRSMRLMRELADASEESPVIRWMIEARPVLESECQCDGRTGKEIGNRTNAVAGLDHQTTKNPSSMAKRTRIAPRGIGGQTNDLDGVNR